MRWAWRWAGAAMRRWYAAGADSARVTAEFDVAAAHPARQLLAGNDIDVDGSIIVRRQVKADGGSRAYINDQPVSAALLREVGGLLVEIHGQSDDRGLLAARGHRALLDSFGGLAGPLAAVRGAWAALSAARAAEAEAAARLEADARDREWLDHAVKELATLGRNLVRKRTRRSARRHAEGRAAD